MELPANPDMVDVNPAGSFTGLPDYGVTAGFETAPGQGFHVPSRIIVNTYLYQLTRSLRHAEPNIGRGTEGIGNVAGGRGCVDGLDASDCL